MDCIYPLCSPFVLHVMTALYSSACSVFLVIIRFCALFKFIRVGGMKLFIHQLLYIDFLLFPSSPSIIFAVLQKLVLIP